MATKNYYESNNIQSTAELSDSTVNESNATPYSDGYSGNMDATADSYTKTGNYAATAASGDAYEPDDEPNYASRISVGSTQTHSLSAGDVDWVFFEVSSSGQYTIETTGSGDTKMWLYQLNGSTLTQLESDDDGGDSLNAKIVRTLSSGTYFVKVSAYSSSSSINSYGIRLTSATNPSTSVTADSYENDNSRFKAKTLSVGSSQTRSIHSSSDVDWIKFTVANDGFYSLVTSGGDTILELYTMEGQFAGRNDDRGNSNLGSQAIAQLYANTSYYAKITSYGGKTFNYTVSLTSGIASDPFESNNDNSRTTTTTALSVGTSQDHTIHNASDVDWMKISLSETDSYMFAVSTTDRTAAQVLLEVYNSSGTKLAQKSGNNPYCYGELNSGTYYIKVSSATGAGTGAYSVVVSKNDWSNVSYDSYENDDYAADAGTLTMSASQTTVSQTRKLSPYTEDGEVIADQDWIKFSPSVTGIYSFNVSGTSAFSTLDLWAYADEDDIFMPVGNASAVNPYLENYLIAGNTYYAVVSSEYPHLYVPTYTFTATRKETYTAEADTYENDNSNTNAKVLTVGNTQAHSLHNSSDVDWMKFTPSSSGYYTFYTGARNGNAGESDLMLGLYDASGKLLIYDDDSFTGYNAMLSYQLSAGSTYYLCALSARENQVVPYYTVSVASGIVEDTYDIYMDERSIVDDTMANGSFLQLDKAQTHSIHSDSDVDWVWFYVTETGAYTVQTEGSGDTILSLYSDTGNFLVIDDDSGVGNNAAITYQFQANRLYNIKVSSYQNSLIPNYTLSLTKASGGSGDAYESDNTYTTAKGIVAGETQARSIHAAGDVDWVKIRPIQSGAYQIQTTGDGDMKLDLYAADGRTLLSSDDDSGVGLNARIGCDLNANTDYYIKAYTYNTGTIISEYGLSVSLLVGSELGDEYENDNSPTTAKAITLGATQTHSIHIAGDVDWITFTPTVSAEYTIQTVGSGLNCDTQLYLYTSLANAQSNTYLQWDDDGGADRNALISRVLTAGTTYYIKAKAWDTYTIPSYGLKVTQNNGSGASSLVNGDEYENDNASGNCKPIAVGREYTHSIHVQSDTDWVRFFTHQTGTYTIQTTGDSDMSFIVYKREPGGPLVPYENGDAILGGGTGRNPSYRVHLETDNWYYVRITTEGRATTSPSYGIRVDIDSSSVRGDALETEGGKSNDNAPSRANWLTLGYQQQHSIHTPGDVDWVVYKAANSGEIVISADNESGKEMRLFLYRKEANGSLTYIKETTYGSYGYTATTLATQAGNLYYIRAQAHSSTQTIDNYSISATYVKDNYEDDNTSSKATLLTLATAQTHNIHSQNDEDWFKFVVSSAGTYEFETSGNGDTRGILYKNSNGSNSVVAQASNGGTGNNFKIRQSLSAGTYYLRVTGENNALVENYSIVARRPISQYDEPNDSKTNATSLALNTSKTGSFHSASDIDYFKLSNTQNGTYKFQTNTSSIKIELYSGSSNTVVASGVGSVTYQNTGTNPIYARLSSTNNEILDSYTINATYTQPVASNPAENYVVMFSGGGDIANNWNTFIENFGGIYSCLRSKYNIPADHIYVLYADGTNSGRDMLHLPTGTAWDTDVESFCPGAQIYSATKTNLQQVMSKIATLADSNDHVLVYTFDHGGDDNPGNSNSRGKEYIVPWSGSDIYAGDFAAMASKINAGYQTYLFAQCYSGGILDALNTNRSGIKIFGAAAANHYTTASAGITNNSQGIDIYGFNYQVWNAFYNGISTTQQMTTCVRQNPFRNGDGGYETGSNFQIFAQA